MAIRAPVSRASRSPAAAKRMGSQRLAEPKKAPGFRPIQGPGAPSRAAARSVHASGARRRTSGEADTASPMPASIAR